MSFNFQDQTVLITGAARGIGQAIAQAFAAAGARVAVHYHHSRERAEQTLAELPGSGHMLVQADLTDPQAVEQMVAQVVTQFGRLNVLVNNAATSQPHPLVETDYPAWQSAWRQTLETNLIGPANVTYCAAQAMMAQGGGRIVNVSSRGAFRGEPNNPAYGASKAGLNAMSQSLAQYLAPYNVFIMVVAPGFVETERVQPVLNSTDARQQSPLKRVAWPEEVAYTILFLASTGAEFLTGGIVDVNGASYLRS